MTGLLTRTPVLLYGKTEDQLREHCAPWFAKELAKAWELDAAAREVPTDKCQMPDQAARLCWRYFAGADQEVFCVIALTARNTALQVFQITKGLVDATLVHPREVFRNAIKLNAVNIVLLHNHPAGDPTPSAEDIRVTNQLCQAGKVLDIPVLDHVIVGRTADCYFSIRESGIVKF